MDTVKIQEPLYNFDHNQIRFNIKLKSENTNTKYVIKFHKGKYKDMRKYLAKLRLNNNKNATESSVRTTSLVRTTLSQLCE